MSDRSNFAVGCVALLVIGGLLTAGIVLGVRALINRNQDAEETPVAEAAPAITEIPAEEEAPVMAELPEIDEGLGAWDAFALGNDAYEAGNYALAEAYYRHAVQYDPGTLFFRNNLGLALLQQEQNEEALEIFRTAVREAPGTYGYWVNLLVAAHANGISAKAVFDEEKGWDYLPQLAAAAQADPAAYTKVLEAIYYNAAYMDMELNGEDAYYDSFYSASFASMGMGIDLAMLQTLAAAGEYDEAFYAILYAVDQLNSTVYGESDPDIQELLIYLDAKAAQ